MNVSTQKILIAQSPISMARTVNAVSCYQIETVSEFGEACQIANEKKFDLFLIGVHFDESRGIDFVNVIRTISKHQGIPIILIRFVPTLVGESLKLIADALVKVGAISQYLEVEGEANAENLVREAVANQLARHKFDTSA